MNVHARPNCDPSDYREYWFTGALPAVAAVFLGVFLLYLGFVFRMTEFIPASMMSFGLAGVWIWERKTDEVEFFESSSKNSPVDDKRAQRDVSMRELIAKLEKSADQQREFARRRERQSLKGPEEIYVVEDVGSEDENIVAYNEARPVEGNDNEELIE